MPLIGREMNSYYFNIILNPDSISGSTFLSPSAVLPKGGGAMSCIPSPMDQILEDKMRNSPVEDKELTLFFPLGSCIESDTDI